VSTRRVVQVVSWLASLVVATALGLTAVTVVGDLASGRGPLGQAVTSPRSTTDAGGSAAPGARAVRRVFTRDFGTFTASCTGPVARAVSATARPGTPWRVVRFEPGPDDDIAVVFRGPDELVEVEVFCNRGRPTVSELDRSRVTGQR
jgi:hypothetical protein